MHDQELDRYWKTVVDTIRDGIMIVNPRGVIVSVNRAMEAMTGYGRKELVGQVCDLLDCDGCVRNHEDDETHWCELFRQGDLHTRKCLIRRKDGRYIHAIRNASLLRDGSGRVIGAVGTITDVSELIEKDIQLEAIRRELRSQDGFHGIIGTSAPMRQVFDLIENAAHSDAPVIIYGESGTGKELVGRAIHEIGDRKSGPYVKVNCASLTDSLLESELFGHVRGAFTGAVHDRVGRFEKASQGDLFLDEIGDLPMRTQVKLLRVLEEKTIERVGSSTAVPVDVRIISATNRDLGRMIEEGAFRQDFYFRINVIPIQLAPLRERREDIPLLAESFFRKIKLKSGKDIEGISNDAMEVLIGHGWPGNVRELKSAFEYAFVACNDTLIRPHHFPQSIYSARHPTLPAKRNAFSLKEIEKQELVETLERTNGNQSLAAELLGVSRVTVHNRMKRYGITARKYIRVNN